MSPLKKDNKPALLQIQEIYQLSFDIKKLRNLLCINEDGIVYKLKNIFRKKQIQHNDKTLSSLNSEERKGIIKHLSIYKSKLQKIYNSFSYIFRAVLFAKSFFIYYASLFNAPSQIVHKRNLLIVFGVIPFNFRHQRPQQLVRQMAKSFDGNILYVNPTFLFPSNSVFQAKNLIYQDGVYIFNPPTSQDYNLQAESPLISDERMITYSILNFIDKLSPKKIIMKFDHPFWSFILNYLKFPLIYDCIDSHESFEVGSQMLTKKERSIVRVATLTLATSLLLYKKMKSLKPKKLILMRNACEFGTFSKAQKLISPKPSTLRDLHGKKIIGYYGAIAEWFDEAIVFQIAKDFPDSDIVLIGEVSHPTIEARAKQYKNIHFLGEIVYQDLPKYLSYFDVCIIPFVINDLIRATNPVKAYEYLSTGKPIVASNIPELQEYGQSIHISKSCTSFSSNIRIALNENRLEKQKDRIEIARTNTWEQRTSILLKEIEALV